MNEDNRLINEIVCSVVLKSQKLDDEGKAANVKNKRPFSGPQFILHLDTITKRFYRTLTTFERRFLIVYRVQAELINWCYAVSARFGP